MNWNPSPTYKKIEAICIKVLERTSEKYPHYNPLAEENGKKIWCVYTPIFTSKISKQEAQELKKLCQEADPKKDFRYLSWVNQEENLQYYFESTLPKFIQELDKIIGKVEQPQERERERERRKSTNTTQTWWTQAHTSTQTSARWQQ